MKLFRARPLTLLFLSFFTASCLFTRTGFFVRMGAVTAAVFGITLLVTGAAEKLKPFRDPVTRQLCVMGLAGLAAAGLVSAAAWDFAVPWYESRIGAEDRAVFRITECENTAVYASRYRAEVMESDCLPRGTKIVLETGLSGLGEGTLLEGDAVYGSLADLGTDTWNARQTYLADGYVLRAEGSFTEAGMRHSLKPSVLFSRLRDRLSAVFIARAGRDAGGFASAILLGNRDHLPDGVKRDFRRLGLSHLLAVSGTHFAVMIGLLTGILGRLRLHRRYRAVLSMAVIVLFMLLTGGSPSVVRAGIMHLLIQLSMLVSRKADTVHSFALSGVLMVLFRPLSAVSCSLQLSYAATWACIVWLTLRGGRLPEKLRETAKRKKGFIAKLIRGGFETVMLTVIVTTATMPLIWLYFGELPLLSVPANLLFAPLLTVMLYLGWICLIFSPLRAVSAPFFALLGPAYRLLAKAAEAGARIPGTVVSVRYAFAPFLLIPAAVCLFAVPLFENRGRRRAVFSAAVLCALLFTGIGCARLIGRGDVVLIRAGIKKNEGFLLEADNRILLCDMTDGSSAITGRLLSAMEECHACEIDAVVLTHYHNKHAQLLGRLCTREIVRSLWLPEPETEEEAAIRRTLEELCAENGVELRVLQNGEAADFHGVPVTIFGRTKLSRSSHPVSGAAVDMPLGGVFFGSCSFNESEELLRAAGEADVVILGGHSPVYKKTFALPGEGGTKVLAMCADAEEHADPGWLASLTERDPGCRVVSLDGNVIFALRDRKK